MQLVILGKGDQKYEEFFDWAAKQYPGRLAVRLAYNEALSMAIYSGADLFLMPSKSEPCGLSQMIAMRYGTVPIVRETGGLKDSVQPYEDWRDAGTGFTFANYSSSDMLYVIREAVSLYLEYPEAFARLRQRAMECDFTWNRSANEYLRIYAGICGKMWPPAQEEAVPFEETSAQEPAAEEKPVKKTRKPAAKKAEGEKKAPAKKRTTKKAAAAEAPTAEVTETPAEEKKASAKKRTTKKAAAAEAPAAEVTEVPAEEKKAPAKKRTTKKAAAAAEAPVAEVTEAPVEEKKPAKKTTAKKTTAKTAAKKAAEEEK